MTRSLLLPAKPGSTVAAIGLAVTEFLAFVTFTLAADSGSGMSRAAITLLVCIARAAARNLGLATLTLSRSPT